MEYELSFINEVEKEYDSYQEFYQFLANRTFKHLKLDGYYLIEVCLVSRDMIHHINKEYRNVDRPTDVISFAFNDPVEGEVTIKYDNETPNDLGLIYICVEVAIDQAKSYAHSVKREMGFLFVHGLLHLLSYNHEKEEDEKVMFKLQDEILDGLDL